jgi:glycosyltransferase involved in cell wall biosynthesis
MTAQRKAVVIAYLAPEIPALSATFVYEELLGVERRGIVVIPCSVHRPGQPAQGQHALAERVRYLYDGPRIALAASGLAGLVTFHGAFRAVAWLVADLLACGPSRLESWKLVFQFLAGVRLARILRSEGCRHLHVHFAHVPTQIAMYASALAGVPFTVMAHANDIFERGQLLRQKAERSVRLLTISEHNKAYLIGLGVPEEKLDVMRCGVSLPIRDPVPEWEARSVYRLGTLGRLVEKKGIDVLVEAVALLGDRPYRVELTIAGDGPLRSQLENLAKNLDLEDRVRFEGNLDHRHVPDWMHRLDAFVLASKPDANGDMDGIPVVLMEAMSQSIPVVSTRLSGIPELVLDGETGLLAEPGDAPGLADQIDRLLSDPGLRRRLAMRAQEHVLSEFGQDINIDRLQGHIAAATL